MVTSSEAVATRQIDYPRWVTGLAAPLPYFYMLAFAPKYAAFGVLIWLASYWAVGVVPMLWTALIPIVGFGLMGFPLDTILWSFVHPALILIVGPTLAIVAAVHCGLIERIALFFMRRIGSSVRNQCLFWVAFSTIISDFAADTVTALALIPIGLKMLARAGYDTSEKIAASKEAMLLVIAISIGSGLGGILTPMAGGQAAITWAGLNAVLGGEVTAWSYTIRYLFPTTVCLGIVLGVFALLARGTTSFDFKQLEAPKAWTRHEKVVLVLLVLALGLPYVRPWLPLSLPWIYGIMMIATMCLWVPGVGMILPVRELVKFPLNTISVWPIAMCVSIMVGVSGAGATLIGLVGNIWDLNPLVSVGIWVMVCLGLAQLASDTASAGILVPLLQTALPAAGLNPVPWIMMTGFSVDLSFMVPSATGTIGVLYALGGRGHWRLPVYGAACAVACGTFSWLFWAAVIATNSTFYGTLDVIK
jgi:sodium-dependent dicarboxylate transporter 2/3/5